jgi:PAS domain-containing protein
MHDQHRDKRDLIIELTDLRKQVADLKHSAAERRRIEDGLRRESELLRALVDTAPATLCLRLPARELLIANQTFATLLGYSSAGEMVRIARELGLFANGQDLGWLADESQGKGVSIDVDFRTKDGAQIILPVIRSAGIDPNLLTLAVYELAREHRRAG